MSEMMDHLRCRFVVSQTGAGHSLSVGSVLNLTLDIPDEYAGDGVGSLRCCGHVVSVEESGQPGKISVVCEIDELECAAELRRLLSSGDWKRR